MRGPMRGASDMISNGAPRLPSWFDMTGHESVKSTRSKRPVLKFFHESWVAVGRLRDRWAGRDEDIEREGGVA